MLREMHVNMKEKLCKVEKDLVSHTYIVVYRAMNPLYADHTILGTIQRQYLGS